MNYKLLGKTGLKVSEVCLGTMTFGEEWGYGANKEISRKVFNTFVEAGGNFVDTANRYTEGTSESFLGEFAKPVRDKIILATKYSLYNEKGEINAAGNNRKNMIYSLEKSLKRLQTEYIDLYYLHIWDGLTGADEILRAFDDLISSGKILYAGISDTPAWIVSQANTIAEFRGWNRFQAVQAEYSLITRDAERDLLPMADSFDMAVTAWAPLAGGALTGKYLNNDNDKKRLKPESKRLNERSVAIAKEVYTIAQELGVPSAAVAVKWVMQRPQVIIPVIGAKNAEQLKESLAYSSVTLSDDHLARLEKVSAIEYGFPHDFIRSAAARELVYGGMESKILKHRS